MGPSGPRPQAPGLIPQAFRPQAPTKLTPESVIWEVLTKGEDRSECMYVYSCKNEFRKSIQTSIGPKHILKSIQTSIGKRKHFQKVSRLVSAKRVLRISKELFERVADER